MMYIEEEEDFVKVVTDEEMRKKLTEYAGTLTDDYWINITSEDDLYEFNLKPKDGNVSKLKKYLERRLH